MEQFICCPHCGARNLYVEDYCWRCKKQICINVEVIKQPKPDSPPSSASPEPNSALSWNNKGNEYYKNGDYESALDCYRKRIEIDPTYWAGWYNFSLALSKLGRKDEAAKAKKKSDELKKQQTSDNSKEILEKAPAIDNDKKETCLNCGAVLPYSRGKWPVGKPKLCPKCGVRVKDPIKYGSGAGQGRTHEEELKSPGLAAFLSILPGLGQVYNGQTGKGLLFLFGTTLGLILIIPGLLIWVYGIFDAYKTAKKMNFGDVPFLKMKGTHVAGYSLSIMVILLIIGGYASGLPQFLNTATSPRQPCGGGYCPPNSVCINGRCLSCEEGYVLGTDQNCHQPCGTTKTYCPDNSICVNGKCLAIKG